jgi:hypothetical protein
MIFPEIKRMLQCKNDNIKFNPNGSLEGRAVVHET